MRKKIILIITFTLLVLITGLGFYLAKLDRQLKYSQMEVLEEKEFLNYFSNKIDTNFLISYVRDIGAHYFCDTSKFLFKEKNGDYLLGFHCYDFNILFGVNLENLKNNKGVEFLKFEPSGLINNILFRFNKTIFYDKIEMNFMGKKLPSYFDCKSKKTSCSKKECSKIFSECKFSLEIKMFALLENSGFQNFLIFYLKEPKKENLINFLMAKKEECGLEISCTNFYCEYCGLFWALGENNEILGSTSYQSLQSLSNLKELK